MDLKTAYKTFNSRLEKTSTYYKTICSDKDSLFLSTMYLVKSYKDYILHYTGFKSPRISKISNLTPKEEVLLGNLLEACIIYSESFGLDLDAILKVSTDLKDPYDSIDIILNDHCGTRLSDDSAYEEIILSVFNILIDGNFELILKNLFLKYSHIKYWK